jgi:hypothetical protein
MIRQQATECGDGSTPSVQPLQGVAAG